MLMTKRPTAAPEPASLPTEYLPAFKLAWSAVGYLGAAATRDQLLDAASDGLYDDMPAEGADPRAWDYFDAKVARVADALAAELAG